MKHKLIMFAVIVISVAFVASTYEVPAQDQSEYNYIGVKKCGMCHKKDEDGAQLKIWEESQHAKAFKTLQTAEADKIAKELGHDTPAAETDACLKCHVTGHDLPAERMEKGFDMADGVQCETCHGPGSEYKSIKIMKDHDAAVANGMTPFASREEIQKSCLKCHNEESPTYKPFVFEEKWEMIDHAIPGTETKS